MPPIQSNLSPHPRARAATALLYFASSLSLGRRRLCVQSPGARFAASAAASAGAGNLLGDSSVASAEVSGLRRDLRHLRADARGWARGAAASRQASGWVFVAWGGGRGGGGFLYLAGAVINRAAACLFVAFRALQQQEPGYRELLFYGRGSEEPVGLKHSRHVYMIATFYATFSSLLSRSLFRSPLRLARMLPLSPS